jgi:hypothetical protein
MPGFRRSQTTTQSLMCSESGCAQKANDMCVEHMAAFCAEHFQSHLEHVHGGKAPGPTKKKA